MGIILVSAFLLVGSQSKKQTATSNQRTDSFQLEVDSTFQLVLGPKLPCTVHAKVWISESTSKVIYSFLFLRQPNNELLTSYLDTLDLHNFAAGDFSFIDANFDGYMDIEMSTGDTRNGSSSIYSIALFDTSANKFQFSQEFSDLCCDLTFDSISKTIVREGSQWSGSGIYSWKYTYKVLGNQPISIEEEDGRQWHDNDTLFDQTIIRKLINGKMALVTDKTTHNP